MHVKIKSETRNYQVAFEQGKVKRFKKGPNKDRAQIITTCKIYLLTEASGPTLISSGVTVLGSEDKPNDLIGCNHARKRGIDVTMLAANLDRTVSERIRRHGIALNLVQKFQPKIALVIHAAKTSTTLA